ncbi:helix-turn-helix transcriptional regulator [Lysinibacillus fusiformis]|uniref:helix-turn-helix transcriptional regulator n=1 Tax=Lysinibacillus fusiformis TaxID=28031 RepID=UPI000886CCA2|nr:helix-turn-helix transcriptional regulator [Lysinibacillus fusiformis]SCX38321.1 Helix-turn-helix [Lysinibacillus fusiformis]SDB05231.1 Helix-turn-helix [Lysinibacillus fusiformis]SFH74905.1 Helix-turn-helix [Lysinibacillus fusiformis]SFT29718.1 Helix-turn-helix [Lysinibacillus fusiformis]
MQYTLDQARILAGLTQKEMAKKMKMSEKTYIQYEKYRRIFRMDQAYLFMRHVNVPFDTIIFFAGQLQNFCSSELQLCSEV